MSSYYFHCGMLLALAGCGDQHSTSWGEEDAVSQNQNGRH